MSTARTQIIAQREAYVAGIELMYRRMRRYIPASPTTHTPPWSEVAALWISQAAKLFPMATVKRPRVLTIQNMNPSTRHMYSFSEYKVEGGKLYYRFPSSRFDSAWKLAANETPETLQAKIRLFEEPTEEVEIA